MQKRTLLAMATCLLVSQCLIAQAPPTPSKSSNGKYGFKNQTGAMVVPAQYDLVVPYTYGLARVVKADFVGVIDLNGREVLPTRYTHVIIEKDGYLVAYKQDKTVEIWHKDRGMLSSFKDALCNYLGNGFFNSFNGKANGLLNEQGQAIMPFEFASIELMEGGKYAWGVHVPDKKRMIYKLDGSKVNNVLYDGICQEKNCPHIYYWHKDVPGSDYDTDIGYFNAKTGTFSNTYKGIEGGFVDGRACVYKTVNEERLYGYIDENFKEIVPIKYVDAEPFSENLAAVSVDLKAGMQFINRDGKTAFEGSFQETNPFSQGRAVVKSKEGIFVIDKQGQKIGKIDLPASTTILNAKAAGEYILFQTVNEAGISNLKGEWILRPTTTYKVVEYIGPDAFAAYKDDYSGIVIINASGKQLLRNTFEYVQPLEVFPGYWWVSSDDKQGIINSQGKLVLPLEYEIKQQDNPSAPGWLLLNCSSKPNHTALFHPTKGSLIECFATPGSAFFADGDMFFYFGNEGKVCSVLLSSGKHYCE